MFNIATVMITLPVYGTEILRVPVPYFACSSHCIISSSSPCRLWHVVMQRLSGAQTHNLSLQVWCRWSLAGGYVIVWDQQVVMQHSRREASLWLWIRYDGDSQDCPSRHVPRPLYITCTAWMDDTRVLHTA